MNDLGAWLADLKASADCDDWRMDAGDHTRIRHAWANVGLGELAAGTGHVRPINDLTERGLALFSTLCDMEAWKLAQAVNRGVGELTAVA